MASVYQPKPTRAGVDLGVLATVVAMPVNITDGQRIDRLTRRPLGQVDHRRAQVIALDRTAQKNRTAQKKGLDEALLRVARGDWPDLHLSLAESGTELHARIAGAENAVSQRVSDDNNAEPVGHPRHVITI